MWLRSKSQGELGLQTEAAGLQTQIRPSGQVIKVRTLRVAIPANNVVLAIQTTPQRNVALLIGNMERELTIAKLQTPAHGNTLLLLNLNEIPGWIQSLTLIMTLH